jgi:hypothetical protein
MMVTRLHRAGWVVNDEYGNVMKPLDFIKMAEEWEPDGKVVEGAGQTIFNWLDYDGNSFSMREFC